MVESDAVLVVGVLGPLKVSIAGCPIEVRSGRLRTLLAALAISATRPVSIDRLATALWAEDLPADARRSIHTYVTRLRGMLGAASIATEPTGYALRTKPDCIDAVRFNRLLDQAVQASDPSVERARVIEALELWRGAPFDGLPSDWLLRSEAPRLVERYLTAIERRIDMDIADNRLAVLVAELRELTTHHPLRESLWARLLVVLGRSGRQAEALECYEKVRMHLAEELGADPGPALRQAHADLLNGQTPQAADGAGVGSPAVVVPRELPADIDGFTGRDAELQALNELLERSDHRISRAVRISVIAGTAGIGKTTLAVHWAQRVADQFPDGQLYVNLRGFDPSGQAMEPAEAVRGFLAAMGVPPQRNPTDLDAQAALYRSALAGKRVLLLLDNARDAAQVRSLLPGSPTCLVVVTSRNQLTSLVATGAARPLTLDLLPVDEARTLLTHRLGADRIAAEPQATDEIISRCAGLPLALAIAAARAATHPAFSLDNLAAQLRDDRSSLDLFSVGDPVADTRAVFSWSYRILTPPAARLFRLLGLHPGPDCGLAAAASLAGVPVPAVQPLLAELTRAQLLTELVPGRYIIHDLLRVYAAELVRTHDNDEGRHAAVHRMLDHYLHTAHAAAVLLRPQQQPPALEAPTAGVHLEHITDYDHALAWLTDEDAVLLAAVAQAASAGFHAHAWRLAGALWHFLDLQARLRDLLATQQIALQAASRQGDQPQQALSHRQIGRTYARLRQFDDAHVHLHHALAIFDRLADDTGLARTYHYLAYALQLQDRYDNALELAQQALALYETTGDPAGQATALNGVGWIYAQLGDHREALRYCQRALTLHRKIGNRNGEASTWDSLGYAHHHLGDYRQAANCYQQALRLYRDLGDRFGEPGTLDHLGEAHVANGDLRAARAAWLQALTILDDLGDQYAEELRVKFRRLEA